MATEHSRAYRSDVAYQAPYFGLRVRGGDPLKFGPEAVGKNFDLDAVMMDRTTPG